MGKTKNDTPTTPTLDETATETPAEGVAVSPFDLDVPSSAQLPPGFRYLSALSTPFGVGRVLIREKDGGACLVRDAGDRAPTREELEEAIARAQAREVAA